MTAAGIIALLALTVTVTAFAYAHLRNTSLNLVSAAVSEYGISPEPLRTCYRAAVLGLAVAALALMIGMPPALTGAGSGNVLAGLALFTAGRAFVGWIPMDPPGHPATLTGRIHWLLGLVSFAGAIYAAGNLAAVLAGQTRWHALAGVSSTLGTVMFIGAAVLLLSRFRPRLRRVFGLFERTFYAGAIIWLGVFAVACAAGSR